MEPLHKTATKQIEIISDESAIIEGEVNQAIELEPELEENKAVKL